MSQERDSSPARSVVQAQNQATAQISHQERFYAVYADIGEIILLFITGEAFRHVAHRVGRILQGAWLPSSGTASGPVLEGLLNKSEDTITKMAKRISAPIYRPGDTNMFRFEDFSVRAQAKTTTATESGKEVSPSSTGVEPPELVGKSTRKTKGK